MEICVQKSSFNGWREQLLVDCDMYSLEPRPQMASNPTQIKTPSLGKEIRSFIFKGGGKLEFECTNTKHAIDKKLMVCKISRWPSSKDTTALGSLLKGKTDDFFVC